MPKMGLDIGDKRIGIAISDSSNLIAQSKEVLKRTDHRKDLKVIKEYIQKYEIDEIIVGLPINMDGSFSAQTKKTEQYINFLKNNLDIEVKTWDERLTSREAEKILIKADLSRKKRKQVIDGLAASIILRNYLDRQKNLNKEIKEDKNE